MIDVVSWRWKTCLLGVPREPSFDMRLVLIPSSDLYYWYVQCVKRAVYDKGKLWVTQT